MPYHRVRAEVNVKILVIVIVVAAAVGVSLVMARQIRRTMRTERALQAGQAAFERQDWPTAVRHLGQYLRRTPDDIEALRQYAEALVAIRPMDTQVVTAAISAYRRLMEVDPTDKTVAKELVMLYSAIGNFEELARLARTRLEHVPNDLDAPLWLAEALTRGEKPQEARQVLTTFVERLEGKPERHDEYVQACVLMSQLAGEAVEPESQEGGEEAARPATCLDWLDRAVAYDPNSAKAFVHRARYRRQQAAADETSEADRSPMLALARKDLEAASALGTDDPRVLYSLSAEWLAHGDPVWASAALEALDALPQEALAEHFFDMSDWHMARFMLASELATRQGDPTKAASLADQTLEALTNPRQRAQILPAAILLYVAADRASVASVCLDEYLEAVRALDVPAEARRLAGLQALVASALNQPHGVISALESVVQDDPSDPGFWRLLADAYSRTGQSQRSAEAWSQYSRLNPQDPRAVLQLARQYSLLGQWQMAYETAARAESLGASDLGLTLLRIGSGISLAVEQGADSSKLAEYATELAQLKQQHPDRVDVRIFQAILAGHLGGPQEAESEFTRAIEACSEPLQARMQLVRHYMANDRAGEAVSVCETACEHHPEAAEPWLVLSDLLVAAGDYEAARHHLQEGLTAVEADEKRSVSIKLALLELVHGDRAVGIDILRKLAAEDEHEVQARLLLLSVREIQEDSAAAESLIGELRKAEGEGGLWWRLHQAALWVASEDWRSRQQEIVEVLQYCIRTDPAWSEPASLLAQMYERLGDWPRLEQTCRQGLAANPAATELAERLLALLQRQGRFAEAQRVLQQVRMDPAAASAWQVHVAVGTGDLIRAIDELRLRVSNDDQDAGGRIELARLLYEQSKDAAQALRYLDEARAIAPQLRTLAAVTASILRSEGRHAEALDVIHGYVANQESFEAYWMRAVFLTEEGDLERAEQDYRKLIGFEDNRVAGHELLGSFYAATKRLDEGIAALEEGLAVHPGSVRLQRTLMRLLFIRAEPEDRAKAVRLLTELEEQLPQDAELATLRALQMLEDPTLQATRAAREKLEVAVRLDPTAVNSQMALIGLAMREGEFRAACDYAIRALEANPENAALLTARARAELAAGYVPMAIQLARSVLQTDPNDAEARSVFVNAAMGSDDQRLLEEARTQLESALRREPGNEALLLSRSRLLVAMNQPKAAIPELRAYVLSEPGSGRIVPLLTLADLYRLAGDPQQAEPWIERAEQSAPKNQAVVHARFLWRLSLERWEELEGISAAYIAAEEQNPTTVLRAAEALISRDSMALRKEGVKLCEHAAALLPGSMQVRLMLASSLYQVGDVERAEQIYRELLKDNPNEVTALNGLAWIVQERHQGFAEALELANRGVRLAPDDLPLLDTRATILAQMEGRLGDARRDLERLLKLSASDPRRQARTLVKLGRVCVELNAIDLARQHLERAREIDRSANVLTPEERLEVSEIVQTQSAY
ncbi:MAG: tetratricopeptide repeat protein [Planctomycetota bacterium]|nr:tetratricopeptide repeat protein [Planctomycetota bacterium]